IIAREFHLSLRERSLCAYLLVTVALGERARFLGQYPCALDLAERQCNLRGDADGHCFGSKVAWSASGGRQLIPALRIALCVAPRPTCLSARRARHNERVAAGLGRPNWEKRRVASSSSAAAESDSPR